MKNFIPLASNTDPANPALLLNAAAPNDALIENASYRLGAVRDLATAISMVGNSTGGLQAKDLASFALVAEILTSDAQDLLDAASATRSVGDNNPEVHLSANRPRNGD